MLKPSAVVISLGLSKLDQIISFLESVEKEHKIKIIYDVEERIKNAGKYRHAVKYRYVSIEAFDLYSDIITGEIEKFMFSRYESLQQNNASTEIVNKRFSSSIGVDILEKSELYDTFETIYKRNKQVNFAYSIYIIFKEKLTEGLIIKSIPIEKKEEQKKKKRFIFF